MADSTKNLWQAFYEKIFTPPETGYGSEADMVRWDRLKKYPPPRNENQGPFANIIKSSAWDLIGTKTYRRDFVGDFGSFDSDMACATAACQIFNKANIPWPKDKSGNSVESIDYVIDAFDGRGEPGKLFSEHSGDFKPVGPGELARGDMLILDVAELINRSAYGYQKHMAIITDVYEDGIEVVHDRGSDEPKTSKFYTFEFLHGTQDSSGMFDRAYRYIPSMDNTAFKHLIYKSR